MLALSHELQYPVDEKSIILFLLLQQTKIVLSCQGKENVRCILTINTSTGGLNLKRVCSHKFKHTFKIASTSINFCVFALNILTLKLLYLLGDMLLCQILQHN